MLAAVPGTIAAQEALLKAQVPTTASLKRSVAKLTVVYSGPPRFAAIPGTTMLYAVNTNTYVLQIKSAFYACEGGAWFVAPSAAGPWLLADSVPAVVYTIPATSPIYPVTYVRIYAVTPAVVTFGFTAGYTLGYVSSGVLAYGTGYYYPPVIVPGPVPIYYPYPYTYAGAVWYNPSTGAWARGGAVYGPYGGAAKGGSYYNPSTGAWAHGARGLRTLWRCRCLVCIQPKYRQLCARQRFVGQRQRHCKRGLLQCAHRGIRLDEPKRQSLRALGLEHILRPESDGEHAKPGRCKRARGQFRFLHWC